MRISDWSSDVCSSDLRSTSRTTVAPGMARLMDRMARVAGRVLTGMREPAGFVPGLTAADQAVGDLVERAAADLDEPPIFREIGRASGGERVCQYVWISGVAG